MKTLTHNSARYSLAVHRAQLLRREAMQSPASQRFPRIAMAKCWLIIARGERMRATV